MPSGLFIVPAHLDGLAAKGVLDMVAEREAGGYLNVVTFHPHAPATRRVRLSGRHTVYELAPDALLNQSRVVKVIERLLYPYRLVSSLVRIARRHRIDFIRGQDPYCMGALAWVVSRLTGIPFSISIHSDYDQRYALDGSRGAPVLLGSRWLARRLETFLYKRADLILPIRQSLADRAVSSGAPSGRIRIIPHGLDFETTPTQDTDIRKQLGIGLNTQIVSFAGRLSRENYLDDILEVARRLGRVRKDVLFVLAGGGNEETRIREIVESDPDLHNVRMIGFQPHSTILALRRASATSLCLMGGFSLVEALASGSPTISYDIEWHGELIRNHQTGYLVNEGDTQAVVEKLQFLLGRTKERERMGRAAKRLAIARHSLRNTRKIKIRVYQELVSMRRPTRQAQKTCLSS